MRMHIYTHSYKNMITIESYRIICCVCSTQSSRRIFLFNASMNLFIILSLFKLFNMREREVVFMSVTENQVDMLYENDMDIDSTYVKQASLLLIVQKSKHSKRQQAAFFYKRTNKIDCFFFFPLHSSTHFSLSLFSLVMEPHYLCLCSLKCILEFL